MAIMQKTVPWQKGYDLGMGVDLASSSPMGKAVIGQPSTVAGASGSTVTFELQRIKTTSDLEQSLNISADLSYGSSLFGAGVEARFDFAKRCAVQTMSLFMVVTAKVDLAFLNIDSPALSPDAAAMVDRPDVFVARFGDAFVRGVSRGGFFVGLLRIEAQSSQDSESIATSLEGSYGLFSASAQAKFQEVESKFHAECFVEMYHEGGPIDLAITDPSDPMQILANANAFLKSFVTSPDQVAIPYQGTVAPMTIAQGPLPPNQVQIEHAQDVLLVCAKRRSALLDQLNLLQYIADNPGKFDFSGSASQAEITQAATGTQTDLDTIAACASAAINHPESAAMPKDFAAANGLTFPAAIMPNPLPAATQVAVPTVWIGQSAQQLLFGDPIAGVPRPADLGLRVASSQQDTMDHNQDGIILMVAPVGGTQVVKGSIVNFVVGNFIG